MSEEKNNKYPPPVLLSAIICDRVIFDSLTGGMPSIIGVLQTISAPNYPARHGRLAFFCELTNGHGKENITAKLVDVQQEDKMLIEQVVQTEFSDVRKVVGLGFGFEGIIFPHPGEYRFQIYAGTSLLGERRIICRQMAQQGDKENGSTNQ